MSIIDYTMQMKSFIIDVKKDYTDGELEHLIKVSGSKIQFCF